MQESHESRLALVVEDDYQVQELVAALLQAEGFTVLKAFNGIEALKICRQQPQLQLLMTDGDLGAGVSGIELAETIRKERPSLFVLVMSGTPDVGVEAAEKSLAFLPKPFTVRAFRDRIRQVTQPRLRPEREGRSLEGRTRASRKLTG
jgi:DNA-binding NtrC family response regulator